MVLAPLAWCFPACGGESSSPAEASVELHDLGSEIADVLCQGLAPCCHDEGVEFDTEACWLEVSTSINYAVDFSSPHFVYDGEAAAACLEEARARATCDELARFLPPDYFAIAKRLPKSCRRALVGKLRLGEPCSDLRECAPAPDGSDVVCASNESSPSVCTRLQASSEGTVPRPVGDAGELCYDGVECLSGHCDSGQCEAPTPLQYACRRIQR